MKKIAVIIPVWKRNAVFELCVEQLNVFCEKNTDKADIMVIYILSVDDPEVLIHQNTIKQSTHKSLTIYSDNNKLGQKINDAVIMADKMDFDYIMNAGSDDLFHPKLISLYLPFINLEVPFFGLSSVYFYQPGKCSFRYHYYNNKHLVGAGRMIHRSVWKKVFNRFGFLYTPEICRGMDTHSANNIKSVGFEGVFVNDNHFPYIVDVKSDVNITDFDIIYQTALRNAAISDTNIDLAKYFKVLENENN